VRALIRLNLPLPPTVNHGHRPNGRGGRLLTDKAKAFREIVWLAWVQQPHRRTIEGPVLLKVELTPANKARFDIDNRLKHLLDALQNCLVFNDDHQITDIWLRKVDPKRPGGCVVEITDVARTR